MKAIFDTKPSSIYDDDISAHYHFPRRYLGIIAQTIGDWIVLRRPRADGGNLAYFAAALVTGIDPDPIQAGMSYARLANFLPFDQAVPWTFDGRYFEEALRNIPLTQVGVFLRGRSVRALSNTDFAEIAAKGFLRTFTETDTIEFILDIAAPPDERVKRVAQALVNRIVRDANFRTSVCEAYDHRCALTGLRIADAATNYEAHAAHIFAVADGGPDVVQNGLALSGTVHWLFDHYLISLTDDHRLLVAADKVPAPLQGLMVKAGEQIHLPAIPSKHPHPKYLKRHRERFFAVQGGAEIA